MAEEVTLARLRVDSSGVTTGVNKAGQSLKRGGADVQRFGDKTKAAAASSQGFVGRVFDMKTALTTFAGAVGVVGIASIIATMTRNLLANSEAFKTTTAALRDFFGEFVLGETIVDRVGRKLTTALEEAQIKIPELDIKAAIARTTEFIAKTELQRDAVAQTRKELIEQGFVLGRTSRTLKEINTDLGTFFVMVGKNRPAVSDLDLKIDDFNVAIRGASGQLQQMFIDLGNVRAAAVTVTSPLQALQDSIAGTKIATVAVGQSLIAVDPFVNQISDSFNRQLRIQRDLNAELRKYSLRLQTLPQLAGLAKTGTEELNETVEQTQVAFSALAIGMQAAGAAAAQAFLEAGVSTRDLFTQVLKDLSRAMIIKGFEYTAYAIAAATGIGSATLGGTPSQFGTAAGKFFAIGALAGAGARAGGSASGAGAGEPLGGPFAAPTAATAPVQNITVIVEGSLLGTTPEQLGRDLGDLVNRGIRDGVVLDGQV